MIGNDNFSDFSKSRSRIDVYRDRHRFIAILPIVFYRGFVTLNIDVAEYR